MITNKTAREFIIAKKLFPGGGSVIETDTATGSVANFETNMVAPIVKGICEINPIQEGTGDPSPTNPRPISGTSVLNMEQRGKNLVDVAGRTITSQTTILTGVNFKKGTYILSADVKNNGTIRGNIRVVKTGTSTILAEISCLEGDDTRKSSSSFTLSEDTKLSILCNGASAGYSFTFDKLQIEVGSTATTYEPYTGSTYPIALGRTVYGCELNVTTGVLRVEKVISVFSGGENENWNAAQNAFYLDNAIDVSSDFATSKLNGECLCNSYRENDRVSSSSQVSSRDDFSFFNQGSSYYKRIWVKDSNCADVTAFKTSLSNLPMQLIYPLATPVEIQLEPTEIANLLGVNNIWHDGNGDISVTYKKKVPGPGEIDKRQFLPLIYGKKYYRKEY